MRSSKLTFLSILAFLAAASIAADPVSDTWAHAYDRSGSLSQRLAVMQSITELANPDLAPFLEGALRDVLTVRERLTATEVATRVSLVRLIVGELGKYRAREAAPRIWEVVQQIGDPIARHEALIALGTVGATDHVGKVATFLRNLSLDRSQRAEGEESLAIGAITALEMMHSPDGYAAVFLACRAGFSNSVTRLAEAALVSMVPDPVAVLIPIVTEADDSVLELDALRWGLRSRAPAEAKGRLAAVALEQALGRVASTVTEGATLRVLRTEAAAGIGAARGPATAVPLLARLVTPDSDVNEALTAVGALEALEGVEASLALVRTLRTYNDRQNSGVVPTVDQTRVLVATIRALGSLGGTEARVELGRAQSIDTYSAVILREARASVERIRAAP